MRKGYAFLAMLVLFLFLAACSGSQAAGERTPSNEPPQESQGKPEAEKEDTVLEPAASTEEKEADTADAALDDAAPPKEKQPDTEAAPANAEKAPKNGYCVAIDPAHQRRGNSSQEPIGPARRRPRPKSPAERQAVSQA